VIIQLKVENYETPTSERVSSPVSKGAGASCFVLQIRNLQHKTQLAMFRRA
jgi:hypothetical protein